MHQFALFGALPGLLPFYSVRRTYVHIFINNDSLSLSSFLRKECQKCITVRAKREDFCISSRKTPSKWAKNISGAFKILICFTKISDLLTKHI